MEKFSAYRDPGTGIQPFLTPVPPLGNDILAKATLPLRYILGIARTILVFALVLAYLVSVHGICLVFYPIPPLYRLVEHILIYILGHTVLLVLGIVWIPVEQFNRKRGRGAKFTETWKPKAGDIIVSNWASWVEVLWLALKFNPTFLIPVPESVPRPSATSRASTPITHTPGRRTGTGSANVQVASRHPTTRIPIRGFEQVSLLKMIGLTGRIPPFGAAARGAPLTLEEIRTKSPKPLVIFPECTTSNGRGLLRFASVFRQNVPVKSFQVFVMNVRYDPPTALASTLTHSIPSTNMNPVSHLFALATSMSTSEITIRLLAPSESPGSQVFITSEILSDYTGDDQLSETCAILIAQMGKMKRTGMGWEDKSRFIDFYRNKKHE